MNLYNPIDMICKNKNDVLYYIKNNKIVSVMMIIIIVLCMVVFKMRKRIRSLSREHLTNCFGVDIANLNKVAQSLQKGELTIPENETINN